MIYVAAILLPPLALLLKGRPFQSLLCLILMLTVIGWIPAAIWAVVVINNDNEERRHREMMDIVRRTT